MAGISEGIIYRHFDSKTELFLASIVEPLEAAFADMVEISMGTSGGITEEQQFVLCRQMYARLIGSLGEILPLLGLVLFGDPALARSFYRDTFDPAIRRLSDFWAEFYRTYGMEVASETMSEAILGLSLMIALKVRHSRSTNVRLICEELAELTLHGFFPRFPAIISD